MTQPKREELKEGFYKKFPTKSSYYDVDGKLHNDVTYQRMMMANWWLSKIDEALAERNIEIINNLETIKSMPPTDTMSKRDLDVENRTIEAILTLLNK